MFKGLHGESPQQRHQGLTAYVDGNKLLATMDGIYAIYFTGALGSGQGVILLKDGVIAGADAAGGTYDGKYTELEDGSVEGTVKMTVPPGAQLVTGAAAGSEPMTMEIPLKLPINLGGGHPLPMKTPTGPINIIFKRLRDIP